MAPRERKLSVARPAAGRTRLCRGLAVLALIGALAPPASADCATDSRGEVYCGAGRCLVDSGGQVWCSRHRDGGAQRTRDGRVLCGKGSCEKTSRGQVFCSSESGGTTLRGGRGDVRCQGRCEPGSAEHCESTLADSSDGGSARTR